MSVPALNPRTQDPPRNTKVDYFGDDSEYGQDTRTDEQKKTDRELAERLSGLIEDANSRLTPLTKMIRKAS